MFDYYGVFEEHGYSPATPEEWQYMRTGHDMVWMYKVTTDFTERMMERYMHDHKDPSIIAKEMDLFVEELQRQTGLMPQDTGIAAHLGLMIFKDREFVNDPEGARQLERESYEDQLRRTEEVEEGLENDTINEDIKAMAVEFAEMIENRQFEKKKLDSELSRMEYLMAAQDLDETFNFFETLINKDTEEEQ
jgi:hypothetical protein